MAFLARAVYRGLSAQGPRYAPTGSDWGTNRLTDHLTLTRCGRPAAGTLRSAVQSLPNLTRRCLPGRWDKGKPASVHNLVLLSFDEAEAHEARTLRQVQEEQPEMFAYVSRLLAALPGA